MKRKLNQEISLPLGEERLITAYKAVIKHLYENREVELDKNGNPYWAKCAMYIDGFTPVRDNSKDEDDEY